MTAAALDAQPSVAPVPPTVAVPRRLTISTLSQISSKALLLALNIVSTVAVIRFLGPRHYGDYVKVISVGGFAGMLAEFCLPKVALHRASRDSELLPSVVGSVLVLRLGLSVVAAGAVQIGLFTLHADRTAHVAGLVFAGTFAMDALLATVIVFQASLRQEYEAVVRVVMELVEIAVLVVLIVSHASLPLLLVAPLVGGATGALISGAVGRLRFGLRMSVSRPLLREMLRDSAPLVPALIVGVLTIKLDGYLVAGFRSLHDTGLYGAAFQPVEYLFLATTVVAFPFMPLLSRSFGRDDAAFALTYRTGTSVLLALSLPIPVVLLATASHLVPAVYGHGWSGSVRPLELLGTALVFMSLAAWNSCVLLTGGQQRRTIRYGVVGLLTNLALCLALIPTVGINGAAIGALTANVVAAGLSCREVSRRLHVVPDVAQLSRLAVAVATTGGLLGVAARVGVPWYAVLLGVPLVYGPLLLVTGTVSRDLRRTLFAGAPVTGLGGLT